MLGQDPQKAAATARKVLAKVQEAQTWLKAVEPKVHTVFTTLNDVLDGMKDEGNRIIAEAGGTWSEATDTTAPKDERQEKIDFISKVYKESFGAEVNVGRLNGMNDGELDSLHEAVKGWTETDETF